MSRSAAADLLLLDLALPDGNGLLAARAFLKQNRRGKPRSLRSLARA
ncbi:MAG: hypothetical protein RLZZ21_2612 [Planctomycetota bacterium]|jgi:hypothetical protein